MYLYIFIHYYCNYRVIVCIDIISRFVLGVVYESTVTYPYLHYLSERPMYQSLNGANLIAIQYGEN